MKKKITFIENPMKDNKDNTGEENTGNRNSGSRNTGSWNTGYRNSGGWNTGNGNSGDCNTGYGNSTNRSSGIFCTTEPTVRCFNKETDLKWGEIKHPNFYEFYLTKWIPKNDMTDKEKKNNPNSFVRGGYLKKFTYKEAWSNYWRDTDEEDRQRVLNLPNFDAQIFKDITGIDTKDKKGKELAAWFEDLEQGLQAVIDKLYGGKK